MPSEPDTATDDTVPPEDDDTLFVVTPVTRPFASTVILGMRLPEPYVPADTHYLIRLSRSL